MNLPIDESLQGKILTPPKRDEGPLYTKKGTLRKRRPKTKNQYFTSDTEEAIIEYLNETDQAKRNKIYNERIWYGFHKLTENIIHTFKFYYTEVDTIADLQHEVTAFLLEKLHLYKQDKGKAYSYFGTIAKRYLILYNNNNYKKKKAKVDPTAADEDEGVLRQLGRDDRKKDIKDFIDYYTEYVDKHMFTLFKKDHDRKVCDAVNILFKRRENLEIFNKKALYIYIREMTGVETPVITKVTKVLKKLYKRLYTEYAETGYVKV